MQPSLLPSRLSSQQRALRPQNANVSPPFGCGTLGGREGIHRGILAAHPFVPSYAFLQALSKPHQPRRLLRCELRLACSVEGLLELPALCELHSSSESSALGCSVSVPNSTSVFVFWAPAAIFMPVQLFQTKFTHCPAHSHCRKTKGHFSQSLIKRFFRTKIPNTQS